MGEAAVAAAVSIGYVGVGTIEFLLDQSGGFYFMEMNTRIQVEHPVTEMITSIDLIEEQILVAMGEKLRYKQEDIVFRGHAIECRINAEDAFQGFRPGPGTASSPLLLLLLLLPLLLLLLLCLEGLSRSGAGGTGRITAYLPAGGPFTRMDSHVYVDYLVPPSYDSLLGKVQPKNQRTGWGRGRGAEGGRGLAAVGGFWSVVIRGEGEVVVVVAADRVGADS